jgi:hypothetical protein
MVIIGAHDRRSHFSRHWIGYLILALVIAASIACMGALGRILSDDIDTSGFRAKETPPVADATATARPTSKTGGAVTSFEEGTLLVGKDVKAGRYRAKVPNGKMEFGCYWQRMKGVTGETADIIANGFTSPGGTAVIEIKKTDIAFESHGCGQWDLVK